MSVSVPFIGRLGPNHVSYADVDWLMGREGWHLICQERLLHHCVVVAAVWTHFPVKDVENKNFAAFFPASLHLTNVKSKVYLQIQILGH